MEGRSTAGTKRGEQRAASAGSPQPRRAPGRVGGQRDPPKAVPASQPQPGRSRGGGVWSRLAEGEQAAEAEGDVAFAGSGATSTLHPFLRCNKMYSEQSDERCPVISNDLNSDVKKQQWES